MATHSAPMRGESDRSAMEVRVRGEGEGEGEEGGAHLSLHAC
jgi:hypothetical protein